MPIHLGTDPRNHFNNVCSVPGRFLLIILVNINKILYLRTKVIIIIILQDRMSDGGSLHVGRHISLAERDG